MINQFHLLQIHLQFEDFKTALLAFFSALVVTLIVIPPLISFIHKYHLFDKPNARKEHSLPIPTMGGFAIVAGMIASLLLWFPFSANAPTISFFFSVFVLLALGIIDDLKDLSAKYKFVVQTGVAILIALSGIRISSFDGLLGIYELPVYAQYTFTILAIVGITNAFNLIDGIDGLAGGLAFMSLVLLGLFLTLNGDANTALIAFALAGGILAFMYFNLNPAKIFMGDTGSLVLGFVISVLCIRLMQVNESMATTSLKHAPVFVLALVLIPVFDTLRVFIIRTLNGGSPFVADKTHIHHLLTNQGYSHGFASRVICFIHGLILLLAIGLRDLQPEITALLLTGFFVLAIVVLKRLSVLLQVVRGKRGHQGI